MINGWILTGFPKNAAQMYYLENNINNTFKPSLVVIVDMDEEFSSKRAESRKIDPSTGKVYYMDNKNQDLHPAIKQRLIVKTEDKTEVLNKRLENWKKFSNVILNNQNIGNNILRLNAESPFDNLVESISDAMECAS
jgi:adenylate kinase family enzyme